MSLLSVEIARLIHHHLLKEGYENSANSLISECQHLSGLKPVKQPYKLPRLLGPTLADLLESYFETKDYIVEELEILESVVFRGDDSLPSLSKTLLEFLKTRISPAPQNILKQTCDATVNTDSTLISQDHGKNKLSDQSVQTSPKTCDASFNTDLTLVDEENILTKRSLPSKETCHAGVNTEICVSDDNENNGSPGRTKSQESVNDIMDFSLVYDRLLEDREFQEKIAENINKRKADTFLPEHNISNSKTVASAQDLNTVIKAIVAETQADPAFENFLKDCIGLESEDPTPIGTPESTDHNDVESLASPANLENQGNLTLAPESGIVALITNPQTGIHETFGQTFCTIQNSEMVCDADSIIRNGGIICDPVSMNSLNAVAIVTSSGQISWVPAVVSAAPPDSADESKSRKKKKLQISENRVEASNQIIPVQAVGHPQVGSGEPPKKGRKRKYITSQRQFISRPPVAIAPKPVFTLTIPAPGIEYDQLDQGLPAVTEAVSDFVDEFNLKTYQNPKQLQLVPVTKPCSSPGPSKPMKIRHRPLSRKSRNKLRPEKLRPVPAKPIVNACPDPSASEPSSNITPAMAELLKIAQEACKSMNIPEEEPEQETEVSLVSDVVHNTPPVDPVGFVSTPTSTRRRSHVRQLNFGESPDIVDKPVGNSPLLRQAKRPDISGDNTARNLNPSASHPPNSSSPKIATSPKSPAVRSIRSEIPWDTALRNAIAAAINDPPPPEAAVFATPKGKAKRAKKQSPTPLKETETVDATNTTTFNTTPVEQVIASTSTSTCSSTPDPIISSTPMEKTVSVAAEVSLPRFCMPSDTSYADFVAATILNEMANTPMKDHGLEEAYSNKPPEERVVEQRNSEPHLPNFGMCENALPNREVHNIQQLSLPVLATPLKQSDIVENHLTNLKFPCDGHSSTGFASWDGEIPRTPQIRLDLTSSTSPFQVSLTKGFRFLPAADSPSLAVPATPCIFEGTSNNNSIETPYTGFYQFPAVLNTPRLEAIRQEMSESPGKSLCTTMISPTQVVLGRPTPYFVPSGERSQGPIINQNATPEHIPEPEKLERRRHSSTEMDPLQLEESTDASDAAAALMCKEAFSVVDALKSPSPSPTPAPRQQILQPQSAVPFQTPPLPSSAHSFPLLPSPTQSPSPLPPPTPPRASPLPPPTPPRASPLPPPTPPRASPPIQPTPGPTPYKTDQTLENDLINECQRLEDDPSTERVKLRHQRLIDLFGEDSTTAEMESDVTSSTDNATSSSLAQSTPKTTNRKTRNPKRTTLNLPPKSVSTTPGCARVQGYSASNKADRRKSQRLSKTVMENDESLIQEVLALARVGTAFEKEGQSSARKRKGTSTSLCDQKSTNIEVKRNKDAASKRLSLPSTNEQFPEMQQAKVICNAAAPDSSPGDSSKDDVNVEDIFEADVAISSSEIEDCKTSGKKKTSKRKAKESPAKLVSPVKDKLTTRQKTPVKLFKSLVPPYVRKAISYRQTLGFRKSPLKTHEKEDNVSSLPSKKSKASQKPVVETKEDHQVENLVESISNSSYEEERTTEVQVQSSVSQQPNSIHLNIPVVIENVPLEPEVMTNDSRCTTFLVADSVDWSSVESVVPTLLDSSIPMKAVETNPPNQIITNINCLSRLDLPRIDCTEKSLNGTVDNSNQCQPVKETELSTQPQQAPSLPVNLVPEVITPVLPSSSTIHTEDVDLISSENLGSGSTRQRDPEDVAVSDEIAVAVCEKREIVGKSLPKASPRVNESKEKNRRSNSKLQNYLRLNSLSMASPKANSSVSMSPSATGENSLEKTTLANASRQKKRSEAIVMHKDLVNQIRKELSLSNEFDLYSQ